MAGLCRQLIRRMRLQGVATLAGKRGGMLQVQPQDLLWIEGPGGYRERRVGW